MDQVTPDLVLMDARMPGISGFETCKRLKREKLLSDLPVIFMTGLSETEHVIEGLACGGVDYVTKPIVLDELLARIRVHLGNARLAYETRAALDASGRFLLATDRAGRVLWCTPKARQLLAGAASRRSGHGHRTAAAHAPRRTQAPARCPVFRRPAAGVLSPESAGPDELLFRLAETANTDGDQAILQRAFALPRVKLKCCYGSAAAKPTATSARSSSISPRTVNKHLEQIFVKLGVKTVRGGRGGGAHHGSVREAMSFTSSLPIPTVALDGASRLSDTALIIIDMQTDFCGWAAMSTRWATICR